MHELTWGLPVIAYLFLAGMGAGALTTSASVLLRGGPSSVHFSVARYGAFIAPIPVALGCALLVLELGSFRVGHIFRWINLYKVINLSPMSIGTWFLTVFLIVSVIYAFTFLSRDANPEDNFQGVRRALAWICVPLGIGVGIYTGILLGAMPARPFWNSPILAMLFLLSALSTGIALIMLTRALVHKRGDDPQAEHRYHESGYLLTATDTILIGLELVTIFLFLMYAHLTIGNVKEAVSVVLSGGSLATMFWFWVVLLGLVLPALIELVSIIPRLLHHREFLGHRTLEIIVPVIVLVGGFMLRYVVVVAGQITHPIGL